MKRTVLLLFTFSVFFISHSQIILLDEDFEGSSGLPPGWGEITTMTGTYWSVSPVANTHYLVIPYHSNMVSLNEGDGDEMLPDEYLFTPPINLSDYSSAFLSVDVYFKAMTFLNKTETVTIESSTDGGNTWTTIMNIEGYFNWHKIYVDVSEYCGNNGVRFGFKYSDDTGWLYGVGIDNVKVCVPFTSDGAMQSIKKYDFVLLNDTVRIEGAVQNLGTTTINSFDINWNINDGNSFSQSYGPVGLSPLDTLSFTHNSPWIPTTQEPFEVKAWISNVNGIQDENPSNDTLSMQVINAVSEVPEKKVLLEVFGATWCTICPHAAAKISQIKDSTENMIVAVVHINDPFTCDAGTEIYENYHLFPGWLVTGLVDRYDYSEQVSMDMDRYLWPHHVFQREKNISPVAIGAANNYNPTTRDMDIFLSATFKCDLNGHFRFNCYIVEDSLVYEQANCLTIPDREPYCHQNDWIYDPPGFIQNYIHMNVLREVLGGPWGAEGSLPPFVEDGISYDYQFDFTLPEEFDADNIRIIAIVQQYDADSSKCEVLNAKDIYLDVSTNADFDKSNNSIFRVYPNPAHDYLIVETKWTSEDIYIEIRDINGNQAILKSTLSENELIDISKLESGIYFIRIEINGLMYIEKIVIL